MSPICYRMSPYRLRFRLNNLSVNSHTHMLLVLELLEVPDGAGLVAPLLTGLRTNCGLPFSL